MVRTALSFLSEYYKSKVSVPYHGVFVVIIFLLLIKIFLLDLRVIKLEDKVTKFAQKYALDHEDKK